MSSFNEILNTAERLFDRPGNSYSGLDQLENRTDVFTSADDKVLI